MSRTCEAGAVHYTLHVMLGILTLISAIAMLGPLALRASEGIRVPGVGLLGAFFVSLGVAFMLIEISVMQWLNLFLGHRCVRSWSVLGGLLMFAGLGSMLAGRSPASNVRKITFSMIAVACRFDFDSRRRRLSAVLDF